jgi:hypothetical protein
MALEIGAAGPTLWRAVDRMARDEAGVGRLIELIEGAPHRETADAVLRRVFEQGALRRVLSAEHVDLGVAERLVKLVGHEAITPLLEAAEETTDTKTRERLYDLAAQFGGKAASPAARRLAEASKGGGRAMAQRDLLALLGRVLTPEMPLPPEIDLRRFLKHTDAHVRREAVKLLLRSPKRDEALLAGLADADGRVVYLALTAAHEKCSREGMSIIRGRVERGELDGSLRALGIRAVATQRTSDTLRWLIARVVVRSKVLRRQRLLPPTPETLAALAAIGAGWRSDPEAAPVLALASRSRLPEVREALKGHASVTTTRTS